MNVTGLPTNRELRAAAREQLKGNWMNPVLVNIVYGLLLSIFCVVSFFVIGAFEFGLAKFFLKFKRNKDAIIEDLFEGFKVFGKTLFLQILIWIFIALWSCLFWIPGIIAALSYSMAFYILNDNPNLTAREALRKSKQMMQGHKGQFFLLGLSFIGWAFLCTLSFGLGSFWILPYIKLTYANFYEELKAASMNNNPCEPDMNPVSV